MNTVLYCTRVKGRQRIMTWANLCIDISKDMDSVGGTKLAFPLYFVVGHYNCNTNVLL